MCGYGFYIQGLECQYGNCNQLHDAVLKHASKQQRENILSGNLLELEGYAGYLSSELCKQKVPTRENGTDA